MRKLFTIGLLFLSFGAMTQEIKGESSEQFYSIGSSASASSTEVVTSFSLVGESSEVLYEIGEKKEIPKVVAVVEKTETTDKVTKEPSATEQANATKQTETLVVPSHVITGTKPLAEQVKIALIIGNANYTKSAKLKNPINDANGIDSALTKIGFKVIKVLDADYNTMRKGLSEFSKLAKDADVALFYYAGHGLQVDGENYLIPIGANIETKEQVALEAISIELVIKTLEMTSNHQRLNVLVLDACRSNPFQTWSRSTGGGLAQVNPPNGTLIAFATSPGSTAADGVNGHGLYTGELIKQLESHQRIEDVFINTRVAVEEQSKGRQSPWELARLRGKYYLK
jgi:hypothetical protein